MAALRRFIETSDLSDLKEGSPIELRIEGSEIRLSPDLELAIFRVLQEGMVNASSHAGASRIIVTIRFEPEQVLALVSDDGIGFDVDAALARNGQMRISGAR